MGNMEHAFANVSRERGNKPPVPSPRLGEQCEHGILKRSCEICSEWKLRALEAETRVAELEDANARMREVIVSEPLNSPTRLAAVAEILATLKP